MLALLAFFCICHRATLAADSLQACEPPVNGTVTFKTSAMYTVSSRCLLPVESVVAYKVWSTCLGSCSDETPVQFIARGKRKISAWALPYVPDSFTNLSYGRTYFNVLCDGGILQRDLEPLYIDVMTSSATPIQYTLGVEVAIPFKLRVSQPYFANVSRETPQIFYVEFSAEQTSLVVMVTSTTPRSCAWVSVQNTPGCSPHDTLHSAMSDDIFQTMTTTAVLTIAKSKLVGTSFFVVVMLVNDSFCFNTLEYGANEDLKTLEIIMQPTSPASHFLGPIIGSAAVIIGIGLFIILVYCLYFHMATRCRCAVIGETRRDQKGCCCNKCCPGCCSFWLLWCLVDYCCLLSSSSYFDDGVTCFYGCSKKNKTRKGGSVGCNENQVPSASAVHIEEVDESQLTVTHLTRNDYQQQQMQYATYAWNTMTVGIYYGIPALQLVLSQQSALDTNENICYYNYKCVIPLTTIIAFNNIWSNIGYVVLGIAFIIVVLIRQRYVKSRLRKLKGSAGSNELQGLPGSGNQNFRTDSMTLDYVTVPQHVGVYYAMGFALAMQGVMSGMYHICPNQTSFQFDTSFMFVIGGLIIIAILQSRHTDNKGKSFLAFFMFSLVTLITIIGLYLDKRNRSVLRGVLAIVVFCTVVVFLVSFVYFHHWKLSFSCCYNPKEFLKNSWSIIKRRKLLVARLIVIFLFNCAIITAFVITINPVSYVILFTFVANGILLLGFYIAFKCIHSETGFGPFLVVGGCALVFLGLALNHFKQSTYSSDLTPAESRGMNRPCIWLGFYGNHDVWHFYSALAVFFTLLALLVMDDGLTLANKPLPKIPVF